MDFKDLLVKSYLPISLSMMLSILSRTLSEEKKQYSIGCMKTDISPKTSLRELL